MPAKRARRHPRHGTRLRYLNEINDELPLLNSEHVYVEKLSAAVCLLTGPDENEQIRQILRRNHPSAYTRYTFAPRTV